MTKVTKEFPAIAGIGRPGDIDRFVMFPDAPTFAAYASDKVHGYHRRSADSFNGGQSFNETVRLTRDGDLSAVSKSDALLAKYEELLIPTARTVMVDDVVGAFPNVPAFIAGHPMNMRTKRRTITEAAPIAITVDLISSAGISADTLRRRGIAILALVRALASKRPVELWVACGLDMPNGAVWTCVQLQTAPMDLAHIAPVLCGAGFSRNLVHGVCYEEHGYGGSWPYHDYKCSFRERLAEIMRPAFPHVGEMLCIPSAHLDDPLVKDPEAWLKDQLAAHIKSDITDEQE